MRRREIIAAGAAVLLCPRATEGQPAARVYRLAVLSPSLTSYDTLRGELAKLGFVEGRNLAIDARVGAPADLPRLARELIAEKPDAAMAVSAAVAAMAESTRTVPIIAFGPDPIAQGFAQSLARPGGNVTGVVILASELDGKRLQLLQEATPGRRMGVLLHPATQSLRDSRREIVSAAAAAGTEPIFVEATGAEDYAAALGALKAAGVGSLVIAANPWFYRDRELIARLAREARLATACEWGEMAASGCLIGYGPRRAELYQRLAHLIARVLAGTPASELPIEQPANFELVLNLQTAKALSLAIPPTLLARADEVIE